MQIRKISKINNEEDAIVRIFSACDGEVLQKLIPAEYNSLLAKYKEIKKKNNKLHDLPGQGTLFSDKSFIG